MADGAWSPTAVAEGEFHGVPPLGCWFRRHGGEPVWITGGIHQHWNATGAEGGLLGFPISNFDPETGVQEFEHGVIFWDGDEWKSGKEPVGAKAPGFRVEPPPPVPLG